MTAHILDPANGDRQTLIRRKIAIFRANPDLHPALDRTVTCPQGHIQTLHMRHLPGHLGVQQVHAGAADEIADKGMRRGFKQVFGRAHLNHTTVVHHNHLFGKGQRLGLVMGHIDHGMTKLEVQLFQLRAQFPLHMRVDHGQRFVEQDRVDILAHHAAAKADLLLGIRRQPARFAVQRRLHPDGRGNRRHAGLDVGRIHTAVTQRKSQVFAHGHRVVDHRKLKHLRDVALCGFGVGHVAVAKQHPPLTGPEQPRNDVQQRGLATTGRSQQRIGPAVLPDMVHLFQRKIRIRLGVGIVAVGKVLQGDLGHHATSA